MASAGRVSSGRSGRRSPLDGRRSAWARRSGSKRPDRRSEGEGGNVGWRIWGEGAVGGGWVGQGGPWRDEEQHTPNILFSPSLLTSNTGAVDGEGSGRPRPLPRATGAGSRPSARQAPPRGRRSCRRPHRSSLPVAPPPPASPPPSSPPRRRRRRSSSDAPCRATPSGRRRRGARGGGRCRVKHGVKTAAAAVGRTRVAFL